MMEMMAICPHPPIVLPEVGGKESEKVQATYRAMERLAGEIAALKPDLILTISPHGHVFSDAIGVTALSQISGNLASFGAPQIKLSLPVDLEAVRQIGGICQAKEFYCAPLDLELHKKFNLSPDMDHGLIIPLSFVVKAGWQGAIIPVHASLIPFEELYHFGTTVAKAMEEIGKKWIILASGDLSHRLLPGSSLGYSPQGAVFDELVRQALREGDIKRLIYIDKEIINEAGECGLRPLLMGLGAFDGYEIRSEELSYEGPFGVGYLVAKLVPGEINEERKFVRELYKKREDELWERRKTESPLVKLARLSIKEYLLTKGYLMEAPPQEGTIALLFARKAGAFVSLKKHGLLRGCMGTIEPNQSNLASEVIRNSIMAAVEDPRFEPVGLRELDELIISVDVLGEPEAISSPEQLDPKIYGVIVKKGERRGLLLPDLPGIDTPGDQIRIAKEKAGISTEEAVEMERFSVERFT